MTRRCVSVVLALTCGLLLTVLATAAPAPRRGGTLYVGLDADPATLNPMINETSQVFIVANQIYDTLINYDEKFNPVPRLATSWNASADGKTFTFNLARNVHWHDGRPFSSADVKFTFETLGPRYSATYASVFGALESVQTPDGNTVILRFKEPSAALLSFLGFPGLSIYPRHIWESGDARANPATLRPIGTGAFKLAEWIRGDHVTLVRNDSYFQRELPYLDQIIYRVIPSNAVQISALERGELHAVLSRVSSIDARRLRESASIKVLAPSVAARIIALWPNLRIAPLNSLRVREALSLAADRARMVEQIALGQATTARAPIASTSPYFDTTLPELKRDVAEANRLLDAAGLKRGGDGVRFTLRLLHVATFQDFARTAAILKENLEEVGVRVNIVSGELTTTLDAIFKNWDFDVAVYSGLMGPEPGVRWLAWFTSEGINRAYFTNATGYQNRRVDRLVKESTGIVDKGKRTATYREIQRIIMGDLPMIPLWEPKFISAYRAELESAFTQPDELYINFARTWFRGR